MNPEDCIELDDLGPSAALACPLAWIWGVTLFALVCAAEPALAQDSSVKPARAKPTPTPSTEMMFDVMKTARDPITYHKLNFGEDADAIRAAWIGKDSKRLIAKDSKKVIGIADAWIAAKPRNHVGYALRFLACIEIGRDRIQANKTVAAAVKSLAKHPKEMGLFFNRAVFVHATIGDYHTALMSLVPMIADGRKIAPLRAAHIRALLGCKKGKQAAAENKTLIAEFRSDHLALLEFAKAICESEHGAPMVDTARLAIAELAKGEQVESTESDILRFLILHRFDKKPQQARKLGKEIVAALGGAGRINNWVWALLVRRATEGRYNPLALVCAEEMLAYKGLSPEGRDTASLALFLNGQLHDAIREQERTYKEYGPGDFVLTRLQMFKALRDSKPKSKLRR